MKYNHVHPFAHFYTPHTRFSGISRYMLAMRFQQHIFKHYHSGNDILIFNNWRDRLFGSKKWSKVILVDLNPAYS